MTDLRIDGDTFRVEVEGDPTKPALLLSNSLGTDLSLWDGQMPALTEHFRIIRYDARGHGASVADAGPYSLDRLGRDALGILDALGIETAHVMGLSMGGAIAQWLMINAPERISRAVLANTTPRFMNPEVWNARIATVIRDGMAETATSTIERWFSPAFRAEAPERVAAIETLVRSTPPHGYTACGAALRDMDLREAIRAIEHPVLVLTGADDPAIAAADTACFLDAIADSRHIELPARHISNIEAETAFTEAALTFLLAKLPATRAKPGATKAKRGTKPAPPLPAPARRQARRSSAARGPVAKTTSAKAASGKTKISAGKASAGKPSTATATAKAPTARAATAKASTRKVATAKASTTKGRPAKVQPARSTARKTVGAASPAKAPARPRGGGAHPIKRVTAKPGTNARSVGGSTPGRRASAVSGKPAPKASGTGKPATKSVSKRGPATPPSRRTTATLGRAAKGSVGAKKTAAKASPVKKASAKATSKPAARTPRPAPSKPGRPPTKRGTR